MMVLAILLESTSPMRSLRFPRTRVVVSVISQLRLLFARNGDESFDARDVAAQVAQARGLLQLPAGLLQPQVEHLLAQVPPLGGQLRRSQIHLLQFSHLHTYTAARCREINLVRIGSLVAARRSDSRATASVTPSTSNKTLAGRMTATHDSSGPLPLPMRVSSGFFVNDFCGKMRI